VAAASDPRAYCATAHYHRRVQRLNRASGKSPMSRGTAYHSHGPSLNKIGQSIMSVACPRCGVKAGEKCVALGAASTLLYFHRERWNARPLGKIHLVGLPEASPSKLSKLGKFPSSKCKNNNHPACNGRRKGNHGLAYECSCYCHKGPTASPSP
jgi:hypothetical protein